ncbi:MAG: MFS transporter [Jatrophihabitantaceae bacterium]
MSAPATVGAATRRLVGLTALRWLPVGLTTPVTVLFALSRGLSLREVGLLFTVHELVIVALEFPTGGLADVLGRRSVVVTGALLNLVSCLVYATADSFGGFLAGMLLLAVGRALDSGPVEAWYVDTVHELDPSADVAPGLGKLVAAEGGGLALGAVVGGLLPAFFDGDRRAVPARRRARPAPRRRRPAPAARAASTPPGHGARGTAGGGARSARDRCGGLRHGPGVCVRRHRLRRHGRHAAATAAARLDRATCAALAVLGGGALATLAGPDLLPVAALVFVGYYVAHGANWPLLSAALHGRVTADHRATAVSAMSLALAGGGLLGNLLVPLVARETAFLGVGTLVAISAIACWRLPSRR